jgi:hypothetical protein
MVIFFNEHCIRLIEYNIISYVNYIRSFLRVRIYLGINI